MNSHPQISHNTDITTNSEGTFGNNKESLKIEDSSRAPRLIALSGRKTSTTSSSRMISAVSVRISVGFGNSDW